MKKGKRILAAMLALSLFVCEFQFPVYAETSTDVETENTTITENALKSGAYYYEVQKNNTVSILKYESEEAETPETHIVIPETIDGMIVTHLAEESFAYNPLVETIVIPETVTSIGNSALYRCENLKAIVLCSNTIDLGFTLAEGCEKLEKIYILKEFDATKLCALLVNDMGEEKAKSIEVAAYMDQETILQAYDDYVNCGKKVSRSVELSPSDDSRDYDIEKLTVSAGSEELELGDTDREGPIELAFDGDVNTLWHSLWRPTWNEAERENYLWVEFELEEVTMIDAIRYLPRPGMIKNGDIKGYRVEGSVDGVTWEILTEGTWSGDEQEWKVAEFVPIELKKVRLVATETFADSTRYRNLLASASELRVRTYVEDESELDPIGIEICTLPKKIDYALGEEFEVSGLDIHVLLRNGNVRHVSSGMTELEITGYDPTKTGTQTLTVYWEELSTTFTVTVYAAVGSCGENLNWTLNEEGVLTISGTGAMYDYIRYGTPWESYRPEITKVILEEGITRIGAYAFPEFSSNCLTTIEIPSSVISIGNSAFGGWLALGGTLEIPENVTTIESYAFSYCNLTSIKIPANTTTIKSYAFNNCSKVNEITFEGPYVSTINPSAFTELTGLKVILVPESALNDYKDALSGYVDEKVIFLPVSENVEFKELTGIAVIEMPNRTTYLEGGNLDLTGLLVKAYYNDGSVSELNSFEYRITGYETATIGEKNVTIEFGGKTADFTVDVVAAGSADDFSKDYDVTKLRVSAGSEEITQGNVNLEGPIAYAFDMNEDTLWHSKWDFDWSTENNECEEHLWVEMVLEESTMLDAVRYLPRNGNGDIRRYCVEGKTADSEEWKVLTTGIWERNGKQWKIAEFMPTELKAVRLVATETYSDRGLNQFASASEIRLRKVAVLDGIEIAAEPEKTSYMMGEELNTKGLSVKAICNNGWKYELSNYMISGYDANVEGEQEITVSYGEYSTTFKVIVIRPIPPSQIINVQAIGDILGIHITWSISSEVNTDAYRIYRKAESEESFSLLTEIEGRSTLSYKDTSVEENITYYYYVVGVNEYEVESEPSLIASSMLAEDIETPVVTKLSPANESYLTGLKTISVTAQDNISVVKTELYYSVDDGENWVLLGEGTSGSLNKQLNTSELPDGEIRIKGIAYDAKGNVSSPLTYVYCIDNTGPEQVTGLTYESTSVTATLRWNDVSDNDISYYVVERKDGTTYTRVSKTSNTLGVNLSGLVPDTTYVYRVVGYDAHGNRGIESGEMSVVTLPDVTVPVITKIRPTGGYYSETINLSIEAEDEYNIAQITVQISLDGKVWTDIHTQTYTGVNKSRTLSYNCSLAGYEEGFLYIRALAVDAAGNESESDNATAPMVQFVVDRTAPAAPKNVEATGYNGYIEISWTQGMEEDLGTYSVYRATAQNGVYTKLAGNIAKINYFDRSVEEGTTYYYKVSVNDKAGNESEYSEVISAQVIADTENPAVVSIYPENQSSLGNGYKTISVLATDNQALNKVVIEHSKDGVSYTELYVKENINAYSKNITATIPVEAFLHGESVHIRVTAYDKAGNASDTVEKQYVIDTTAPKVFAVTANYENESVLINWSGEQSADLIGYRVYRKAGMTGNYSLISQRQVVEGQSEYSCKDYNISINKTTYYYKIEAVDACGNVSYKVAEALEVPDRSHPTAVISCENTMEIGVEYVIDASLSSDNTGIASYVIDFGDGTTSTDRKAVHTYTELGTYTITLNVTDVDGNKSTITKKVVVRERASLGTVKIKIVDENGKAVPNAPVYFDLGEEYQVIRGTDRNGYVVFSAEVGKHTVGCVIADNEWLPVKKEIIVKQGEETSVSMTLVHRVMIEGNFEIKRMTFEEIKAAGIDTSKPENQYFVQVNVQLTYGESTIETSLKYNETTGETIAKPIIVNTPDNNAPNRLIIPTVISTGKVSENDYNFSKETAIAYLDIPIGVSTLKEFFDVNLHIINNASAEFSMLENTVALNVPKGLSIVEAYGTEANPTVSIEEIKGQETKTITWILRGDDLGEYYLSADYSGILSQFNEIVSAKFNATEAIEVYGLSNLKLKIEVAEELDHGTLYYNTVLNNEGRIDVYNPTVDTGDILFEKELFDVTGADLSDTVGYSAELANKFGWATSIEGDVEVLKAGERIMQHYMCVDQTLYTEQIQKLKDYASSMENTYGLKVEIVEKPLSYFKENLSTSINPIEKAELTFTTNQSAYEYLMSNENYIYWSMYASTGSVEGQLTTKEEEQLWNLISMDMKGLFGGDDKELVQAIILDAMEISAESNEYSQYYTSQQWLMKIMDWLSDSKVTSMFETIFQHAGTLIKQTFELIIREYKWEFYKAIYSSEYLQLDNFIISTMTKTEIYKSLNITTVQFKETTGSQLVHELFSADGFKTVWEGIGITARASKAIVKASENTKMDISIFMAAQNNLDNCNLFLDSLINFVPKMNTSQQITGLLAGKSPVLYALYENYLGDSVKLMDLPIGEESDIDGKQLLNDGTIIVDAAKEIKKAINEVDVVGSMLDNLTEEMLWEFVDYTKDKVIDKLGASLGGIVIVVKYTLELIAYVGDNVFNVNERHNIADNIRFISVMTLGLQAAITDARVIYQTRPSEVSASGYMQLLSYLLNLRAIGESQVALFGISYEVFPGAFDSRELFLNVKNMSGANDATSWIEWRDYVEDQISMLRIQLLKNPLTTEISGHTSPEVTIDYARGQTVQKFNEDYEYSFDGGETWSMCDGNEISVPMCHYATELQVRGVEIDDTNEKMTTSVKNWGVSSLLHSGIVVKETSRGYCIENLDNTREYEVTFSATEKEYEYAEKLEQIIPGGSFSYEYVTDEKCEYVYIRALADQNNYDTYVYAPEIYEMTKISVTDIFVDVNEEWYVEGVQFVYDNGIMSGNEDTFRPTEKLTRAAAIQTLYNMAGSPNVSDYKACDEVSDVKKGQWYTDAICWAYNEGITSGYGNGKAFGVGDSISRQQLAVFLYRFALHENIDITIPEKSTNIQDIKNISEYALEAVEWIVANDIIQGYKVFDKNGEVTAVNIEPTKAASRAQMAIILTKFCELYDVI